MTKKEFIHDLEKNIYCRIKPSSVHGVGVFAIRDIPKGTNPFLGHRPAKWRGVAYHDIYENPQIPSEVVEYVDAMCSGRNEMLFVPSYSLNAIDTYYYINHSDSPNMGGPLDSNEFVALRDIKKGEELFVDYHAYSDE